MFEIIKFMSKKRIENLDASLSLHFSNNMFQAQLIEFLEKNNIKYKTFELGKMTDIVKFHFKNKNYILFIYTNQSFADEYSRKVIFEKIENYSNNHLYFVFYESEEIVKEIYRDFKFFVETQIGIKIYIANSNQDFFDYISDLAISITVKEEKSKISFYDTKPDSHTNLCEIENITNSKQITWIEQLMCLPGISERKAIAISKEFPDLRSLMDCYLSDEYSSLEKENFLKNIEIVNKTKDKVSKIGQSISSKIYSYFTASEHNSIIN